MKHKIALAQLAFQRGDPERNYQLAEDAVLQAAAGEAELGLLPELWASGVDLEKIRDGSGR